MIAPDFALIVCRFVFDAVALFVWGSSAYLSMLVPAALTRRIGRRLRASQVVAVGLVVAATAVMMPLRAATIGEGWPDAVSLDMLLGVLFSTSVGAAWQVQAVCLVLLILAACLPERYRQASMAVASMLLLASLTITGHASMNDGWLGTVHRIVDLAHVLAGGAWLGALVPVLLIVPLIEQTETRQDAGKAMMRFSSAGHIAVAIVVASGIGNMLVIVGGLPWDWSLPYQGLLCLKILLVGAMIVLAVFNRYVLVPRMASGHSLAAGALVRGTLAEIGLGLVVIGLVAWFGTLSPT